MRGTYDEEEYLKGEEEGKVPRVGCYRRSKGTHFTIFTGKSIVLKFQRDHLAVSLGGYLASQ